jgi:TnsA endonuclease N terminal
LETTGHISSRPVPARVVHQLHFYRSTLRSERNSFDVMTSGECVLPPPPGIAVMARRRYAWTEKRITKFMREGRGLGTGANYAPWLTVSDIPSLGRSHRLFWPVTGREHHLLSDLEYYAFLRKCYDDSTLDIREQFPLPRQETLQIATELGVRHPKMNGVFVVMTTDLLVSSSTSSGSIERAYAVKPDDELLKRRTMEKLDIERIYWERKGVAWPGRAFAAIEA